MRREGVTFSKGEEFTAEDVKFSIERVQSEDWTISLKSGMDIVESDDVRDVTAAVDDVANAAHTCPHCRQPVAIITWLVTPAAARVAYPPTRRHDP